MKKTLITIIVILFAAFTVLLYLGSMFTDKLVAEKIESLGELRSTIKDSVGTDMIGYPYTLRRYLNGCIKENNDTSAYISIQEKGEIRTDEKSVWIPFESSQYYSLIIPEFIWDGRLKSNSIIWTRVIESFENGKANTLVKLLSSLTISDIQSEQLNQSALTRYLLESVLFPTVLYPSENLNWERYDDSIAVAEIKYMQLSAKAKFYFNEANEIYKATTSDKFKSTSIGYKKELSTVLYSDYKWFGNYKVPTKLIYQWNIEDSVFTYSRFTITGLEYSDRLTE